jgi:hypothetical protein
MIEPAVDAFAAPLSSVAKIETVRDLVRQRRGFGVAPAAQPSAPTAGRRRRTFETQGAGGPRTSFASLPVCRA